MSYHRVGHSKINQIEIDGLFKIKALNNETDSTLKVNEQTEEPIDSEESVHPEYFQRKKS